MGIVALARGVALVGAKVPSSLDPTTNFYSGLIDQLDKC